MADAIPWDVFEKKYSRLFKGKTGNVAKPLRTALGALIIQTKFQYSDRELVEQITENTYLQYFIGLPGYQEEPPFDPSTMVLFCKRINAQMIAEANEYMLSNLNKKNDEDDDSKPPTGGGTPKDDAASDEPENKGTLILDATCAPVNIRYPQDVLLLNEAGEKLETILYRFHESYGLELPRRYVKRARKDYLAFAKCKKRTTKKIRKALRQQLAYVKRDVDILMNSWQMDMHRNQKRFRCYLPSSSCMSNRSICMTIRCTRSITKLLVSHSHGLELSSEVS